MNTYIYLTFLDGPVLSFLCNSLVNRLLGTTRTALIQFGGEKKKSWKIIDVVLTGGENWR